MLSPHHHLVPSSPFSPQKSHNLPPVDAQVRPSFLQVAFSSKGTTRISQNHNLKLPNT